MHKNEWILCSFHFDMLCGECMLSKSRNFQDNLSQPLGIDWISVNQSMKYETQQHKTEWSGTLLWFQIMHKQISLQSAQCLIFFFHFPCVSLVLSFSAGKKSGISEYSTCSKWNSFCYCKPDPIKNKQRKGFIKLVPIWWVLSTALSTKTIFQSGGTNNPPWPGLKMKELKVIDWVQDQFPVNRTHPIKKPPIKYKIL